MSLNAVSCLKERLGGHSGVKYTASQTAIKVDAPNPSGFSLVLALEQGAWIVRFDGWHHCFTSAPEAVEFFLLGLRGNCRLKTISRAGLTYQWSVEIEMENGWRLHSTVTKHSLARVFAVWRRKSVIYRQNSLSVEEGEG